MKKFESHEVVYLALFILNLAAFSIAAVAKQSTIISIEIFQMLLIIVVLYFTAEIEDDEEEDDEV